jgi:hypothetical protein
VLIAPTVADVAPGQFARAHGFDLLGHVSDMLINERLYRDLLMADEVNRSLAALDALVTNGTLTAAQLEHVKRAIDWSGRRQLTIVPIRPTEPLPGNSFSAFLKPALRTQYIEAGRKRAREVLSSVTW